MPLCLRRKFNKKATKEKKQRKSRGMTVVVEEKNWPMNLVFHSILIRTFTNCQMTLISPGHICQIGRLADGRVVNIPACRCVRLDSILMSVK